MDKQETRTKYQCPECGTKIVYLEEMCSAICSITLIDKGEQVDERKEEYGGHGDDWYYWTCDDTDCNYGNGDCYELPLASEIKCRCGQWWDKDHAYKSEDGKAICEDCFDKDT